jgi:hypothetical protein
MSRFYEQADAICTSLQALPILADCRIVVDRQHDILSDLRKVIGKQIGNLILVSWTGGTNKDISADGPRIESGFSVTLFSKPILRPGETPADDLAEAIANHLHDWRETAATPYSDRLICTEITPTDVPDLLAHQIKLTTPSQL